MIIPESAPSVQDIDRAWIISYRNMGHVKNNKAGKMDPIIPISDDQWLYDNDDYF